MTEKIRPVAFMWTELDVVRDGGEIVRVRAMVPEPRFNALCARQYQLDDGYVLIPFEHRSTRSHNHLFAAIGNAWDSLPEAWTSRFPTSEHLRKWLLVQVGHADHSEYAFDTAKDAMLFARGLRRFDQYAVIKVSGGVVDVWVARSLSRQAVPTKEEFQKIKDGVLDGIEIISGNTRPEITREAERRALPPPGERGGR